MKYILYITVVLLIIVNFSQIDKDNQTLQNPQIISVLTVPDIVIEKDKLIYQNHSSKWTLNDVAFSGLVESYYEDGSIKQRFGVLKGLRQGAALDWFEDGHLKFSANYHQGRLHGEKKIWYENSNHQLASQLNYHQGKLNGIQMKWYATGEIFKLLNLNMGQEEGIQQAFRKNGVLYANYEAREGRVFGLKRASLCFELEEETLVFGR